VDSIVYPTFAKRKAMTITKGFVTRAMFAYTGCMLNMSYLRDEDFEELSQTICLKRMGVLSKDVFKSHFLEQTNKVLLENGIVDTPIYIKEGDSHEVFFNLN
jgi:hypothetical protein